MASHGFENLQLHRRLSLAVITQSAGLEQRGSHMRKAVPVTPAGIVGIFSVDRSDRLQRAMELGFALRAEGRGDLHGALGGAYLEDLGVNAIEVMPVSNVANDVDWGYLPLGFFGVDERFGKLKLKNLYTGAEVEARKPLSAAPAAGW